MQDVSFYASIFIIYNLLSFSLVGIKFSMVLHKISVARLNNNNII